MKTRNTTDILSIQIPNKWRIEEIGKLFISDSTYDRFYNWMKWDVTEEEIEYHLFTYFYDLFQQLDEGDDDGEVK